MENNKKKLDEVYESIVHEWRINVSDDDSTKFSKLLSQCAVYEEMTKKYIVGLEQLIKVQKDRISSLETTLRDVTQQE